MRCTRCGHEATESDKFCAECGVFLRDAWVDHRLLLALTYDQRGDHRSARRELERFFGVRVFLELRVRVRRDWRQDPRALRELGYQLTS